MAGGYDGVRYFKDNKMSNVWQLEKSAKVINAFEGKTVASSINEAIELYNIQNVINAGIYLKSWDEAKIDYFKDSVKPYNSICAKFFASITDENITDIYNQLWFQYKDDFWMMFDIFNVYKRISGEVFITLIQDENTGLQSILKHKRISIVYDAVLANYIRDSYEAIGIIIVHFFGKEKETLYLPNSLKPNEYDGLFLKYTAWEEANANYLMLLSIAQNTKECPVSDKMKLAAKRAYDRFWLDHKSSGVNIMISVGVRFADQPQEIQIEQSGRKQLITYDLKWLEESLDFLMILNNFIYVFGQADLFYRSALPAVTSEISALEEAFSFKGKNMYRHGSRFMSKHMLYDAQMQMYYKFLELHKISLEGVFKWFFMEYLPSELGVVGFVFNPPSGDASWLDKYKSLVSEMDAILKQYKLYFEDGFIDRELFEISSNPVRISQLQSYMDDKYAYPIGDEILNEIHALFSDQSCLSYTEKTKDKYQTLYQLLASAESMKLSDFIPYQVNDLNWLIERGTIYVGDDGYLHLDQTRSFLLKDLYEHDVLCPRYCNNARTIVDNLKKAGEIEYAGTLFSKPEQEYFNFVLNKAEYVNGMDLRNKYVHGTYTTDVEMQQHDYIQLLKIMIMIIIKMNEEFIVRADRE